MNPPELFRVGDDRLLCDAWQSRTRTMVIRPADPRRCVHGGSVRTVIDELHRRGVEHVLTAALDPASLEPFVAAGFVPHEDLCVLRHDLGPSSADRTTDPGVRIRRAGRRRDVRTAARVDADAFGVEGSVDEGGIETILAATPNRRFRMIEAVDTEAVVAFAISGTAGTTGYVQRLAVDPAWRRHGHGRTLVADALEWFRRRRVDRVLVNTQVTNTPARQLYLSAGFTPTTDRLAVRAWHGAMPS